MKTEIEVWYGHTILRGTDIDKLKALQALTGDTITGVLREGLRRLYDSEITGRVDHTKKE